MRVRAVASSIPNGNNAAFSCDPAIVIRLMPSPCDPAALTFCSVVETRRSETAATCCHEAILRSIAPETSDPKEIFEEFDIDEDTDSVTEAFRQRYLDGDAVAEQTKMLISKPTAIILKLHRIKKLFSFRCKALDLFA